MWPANEGPLPPWPEPRLGQTVHYVTRAGSERAELPTCMAAEALGVAPDGEKHILYVMVPGGHFRHHVARHDGTIRPGAPENWVTCVEDPQQQRLFAPGTWHYPPRHGMA